MSLCCLRVVKQNVCFHAALTFSSLFIRAKHFQRHGADVFVEIFPCNLSGNIDRFTLLVASWVMRTRF